MFLNPRGVLVSSHTIYRSAQLHVIRSAFYGGFLCEIGSCVRLSFSMSFDDLLMFLYNPLNYSSVLLTIPDNVLVMFVCCLTNSDDVLEIVGHVWTNFCVLDHVLVTSAGVLEILGDVLVIPYCVSVTLPDDIASNLRDYDSVN